MTNLEEIKVFTNFYIDEHDRLSEDEKHYLHNFVNDANLFEIENLLVTGEAKRLTLREQHLGSTLVKSLKMMPGQEYTASGDQLLKMAGNAGAEGAAAAVIVASIATAGVAAYRRYFQAAARKCKGKSGQERSSCIENEKRKAKQEQIKVFTKGMSSCNKSKDPQKCKSKIQSKIATLKSQLGTL